MYKRQVDPLGYTITLSYTDTAYGKKLSAVTYPLGNTPYTQSYTFTEMNEIKEVRVSSQKDAYNNTYKFSYERDSNRVQCKMPDGDTTIYQHTSHHGTPIKITDASGESIDFGVNRAGQITSLTDRMGDTTNITYHSESGKILSYTDPLGNTITFEYSAQDQTFKKWVDDCGEGSGCFQQVTFTFYNLTKVNYPDGTTEKFSYDEKGRMIKRIDQKGNTWTYEYDTYGRLKSITNPEGGKLSYTYHFFNKIKSITDPDIGETKFYYDDLRRLIKVEYPDGSSFNITYDLNDRITSLTDEGGNQWRYEYDPNGNLTKITFPDGNTESYSYDLMDRLKSFTSREGRITNYDYDKRGRLLSISTSDGLSYSIGYRNGGIDYITIEGERISFSRDKEGVLTGINDPLSGTTAFENNGAGMIKKITDPGGQETLISYDSMSRIISMKDPLLREIRYGYDNGGLLNSVMLPGGIEARYSRNGLGLITDIRDPNGNNWGFSYSQMGRLRSVVDPLNRKLEISSDTRGRVEKVIYPDQSSLTYERDAMGNITKMSYSDGSELTFTYNRMGELTAAGDLKINRDSEGRIIETIYDNISFGATYGSGGLINSVSYANNTFTVTYEYDNLGLLKKVSDNLTQTEITFEHNENFRITSIKRPNNVNTTLNYNINNILYRIQHGTFVDIKATFNEAGEIIKEELTLPYNLTEGMGEEVKEYSYDEAMQVSGNDYIYDMRGRATKIEGHSFGWDMASRAILIDGARLTYNDVGSLVKREEGGKTIRYYHNMAIGSNLIMAERDSDGNWLRYYIYTPWGNLLYMIDAKENNRVYFYHFDRRGSTICLTDITGNITDSYSYMPYGRLIRHQGDNPQPFTFLGEWGVRQEGKEGRFYQIGVRLYDSSMARFLTREPQWPNIFDPAEFNPYQYALNEPIRHRDMNGYLSEKERKLQEAKAKLAKLTRELMPVMKTLDILKNMERDVKNRIIPQEWDVRDAKIAQVLFEAGSEIPGLKRGWGKVLEYMGKFCEHAADWQQQKLDDLRRELSGLRRRIGYWEKRERDLLDMINIQEHIIFCLRQWIKQQARERIKEQKRQQQQRAIMFWRNFLRPLPVPTKAQVRVLKMRQKIKKRSHEKLLRFLEYY